MAILEGRVVIVTGAGRGIGRGEALECARQGASVLVTDADADAARQVADEIGDQARPVVGDVADTDVADLLVRTAISEFGRLDALVNNAGILRDRTLVKMSDEEWDAVVRVHLRGHFAPTRAVCRYWREAQRPGRIVHTSSASGLLGNFGQANYGAAKAGIAAFSTIVAMEMARYGVTSNAIAPAARTRMTEHLMPESIADEAGFDFSAPENIAPIVAFLCSPDAGHISGKVFGVQGDSVELYQPFTSVAEITAGGRRWDPAELATKVDQLFTESGIQAGPENMMARLRHTIY